MRRAVLACMLLMVAGCATTPERDEASRALAEADGRMAQGDYPAALAGYDAYLARFPDAPGAPRVRAIRTLMQELLAARRDRERLAAREAELAREVTLTRESASRESAARNAESAARDAESARVLAARDTELAKLRQEVAQRQLEVARLREDLEALKRTDLEMERRRR